MVGDHQATGVLPLHFVNALELTRKNLAVLGWQGVRDFAREGDLAAGRGFSRLGEDLGKHESARTIRVHAVARNVRGIAVCQLDAHQELRFMNVPVV